MCHLCVRHAPAKTLPLVPPGQYSITITQCLVVWKAKCRDTIRGCRVVFNMYYSLKANRVIRCAAYFCLSRDVMIYL